MNKFVSSKHLEQVSDLTLSAPIKQGFIDAFEAVTYETRLRKLLEALFKIRSTAREHSKIKPFVDTAERIQSLLDFRLAIVDTEPRQLMLSATFDRAFEPYMRLIWDPLGTFLDLIFCNCEGYVTATDHSFEDYLAWVRSAQIDTDFFYSASGHSVSDMKYLLRIERLDRVKPGRSSTLVYVENPEEEARRAREADPDESDFLGLEALIALYRLTEFYPPDQPKGDGRFLRMATQQLLQGWDDKKNPIPAEWERRLIPDQLRWFREGLPKGVRPAATPGVETATNPAQVAEIEEKERLEREIEENEKLRRQERLSFDDAHIQGGILDGYDVKDEPVQFGALLLMRILDPELARRFIAGLPVRNGVTSAPAPDNGIFLNLAFTHQGLKNIGVAAADLDRFPQEFREGMEARAGLLGDLRESHPRNWALPKRAVLPPESSDAPDGPAPVEGPSAPPQTPVDLSEVDIVIQLRTRKKRQDGKEGGDEIIGDSGHPLHDEVLRLGREGGKWGVRLLAVQEMRRADQSAHEHGHDYFGFRDGYSQPNPVDHVPKPGRDQVARGELLWGYSNDRSDPPPPPNDILDNGTFLVVRKLRQHVGELKAFVKEQAARKGVSEKKIYGKMMGRTQEGVPMVPSGSTSDNSFTYENDKAGVSCPFQAHIRRANPRAPGEGRTLRPTPRILRRGLSYGRRPPENVSDDSDRGVVFMAYNASIAEQYEVIQRWVNGGNATGVGSWLSDPLMGLHEDESDCLLKPKPDGENQPPECQPGRTFRFRYYSMVNGKRKFRTVRIIIPQAFVKLLWGTYLFVPSMAAIKTISGQPRNPARTGQAGEAEEAERGRKIIARLLGQAAEGPKGRRAAAAAWKTYIEDFSSKDPAESADGPALWAAIRADHRGALRVPYGIVPTGVSPPDVVLVGSKSLVMRVFSDPHDQYSMSGQMVRMRQSFGEIFLGMDDGPTYREKSRVTNLAIFGIDERTAFDLAYGAADRRLGATFDIFKEVLREKRREGELDLRRDFLTPVLGSICNRWFGIPDSFQLDPGDLEGLATGTMQPVPPAVDECDPPNVFRGGWNWRTDRKPRCPGDYMATSRYCFYPDPVPRVQAYGREQGQALRKAVRAHFEQLARENRRPQAPLSLAIWNAFPDKDELARTVIGVMTGFLPPADGSLRWTLYEWLEEKILWRAQQDLQSLPATQPPYDRANAALRPWLERAMQKRPSPDLLWRTVKCDHGLGGVEVRTDDKVIIGLVSALAEDAAAGITDVYPIFGGERRLAEAPPKVCPAHQGADGKDATSDVHSDLAGTAWSTDGPLHACPAYKAAMGTILGILAALLDRCRIEALPAPLLVKITDLKPPSSPP